MIEIETTTTVKISEELSDEEVRKFKLWELEGMSAWRLIEIPNPDWPDSVFVGIVHPHSKEFGYEAHEAILGRKSR